MEGPIESPWREVVIWIWLFGILVQVGYMFLPHFYGPNKFKGIAGTLGVCIGLLFFFAAWPVYWPLIFIMRLFDRK